jgi:hypothetical protein
MVSRKVLPEGTASHEILLQTFFVYYVLGTRDNVLFPILLHGLHAKHKDTP